MKLGDITTDVFSGGTPNTENPSYWGGENPWLSSGETRNRFIITTEKTITNLAVEESSTRLAKKDDIVIASAGQGTTRGRVSFCMIDTYINQSVIAVRVDENQVDPIWLFYNLYNRYNELRRLSDANSSRGSITTKLIKSLEVNLPSIEEQRVAATALRRIEEKIICNIKMNAVLKNIGQTIFKSWFIDHEIIQVKADALSSGEDPEAAAIEAICGKPPSSLSELQLAEMKEIAKLFPSELDTLLEGTFPKGWK